MIIKVDYYNNDLAQVFESFFSRFKFINYYANLVYLRDAIDEKSLKLYKHKRIDMEELFDKIFFKPAEVTQAEKRRFAKYVKESILAYMVKTHGEEILEYIQDIKVVVNNTFREKFENGEAIYYFITANKYIVQ